MSSDQVEREAARWIAAEVERAGGRLAITAATLLALFEADRLDAETGERIDGALSEASLRCSPELRADANLRPDDLVEIYSTERSPVEQEAFLAEVALAYRLNIDMLTELNERWG